MKKHLITILITAIIACCFPTNLTGQEITVEGLTTTYDSIPLIKALVKVKSSNKEYLSDSLGYFKVECLTSDKLTFSAKGFTKKNVKISGAAKKFLMVNLEIKPGERNLDLALGPDGHIREADKIKVSTVNDKLVDFSMYTNIYDAIRGRVSGVHIINNEIVIRGASTISPTGNGALMVVDGIIVSQMVFATVPTSDIKSINVLKGSAASIYGSRGGNGVIEVYTKRGLSK